MKSPLGNLFAILMLVASNVPARAHDWYDADCCSGIDCHPIASCDEFSEQPDGSYVWHGPEGKNYSIRKERIRPSKDGKCHVCTSGPYGLCAYIQLNY